MPANWWTLPPKDDKCWQQYTFGVGTFARIDKRPPTLVGRLITRSVRFVRTEKAAALRMTWSDEELVSRSIGGDADSFNQLVLRWERPIYALAYRVIGREEDARDVCQETFLRAFRALGGFRGQAKFSSWLYRIALNLCRDWVRRQRRTPVVQLPEDVDVMELAVSREPTEPIEDLVARHDLTRLVEKAMARLPEEQRTAIILKEYHGLTFQEIADLVGCPLSTVKTRLYQGLTVLRRDLNQKGRQ
jgi:RNA polymerase sigma-70 factor (ECF subfamily)